MFSQFVHAHATALIIYLLLINIVSLAAFAVDKRRARQQAWRIPEATLLTLAILGGSAGAWLGMKLCHHKTRKRKFSLGVPLIFALQVALGLWMMLS